MPSDMKLVLAVSSFEALLEINSLLLLIFSSRPPSSWLILHL